MIRRGICLLLIITLVAIWFLITPTAGSARINLYVYGKIEGCPHCIELLKNLLELNGEYEVIFADIGQSIAAGETFATAYNRLFPDLQKYHIPLTVITKDGEVMAAIFGIFSPKDAGYLVDRAIETNKLIIVYPDRRIFYWDRGGAALESLKELARVAAKYGEPIEKLREEVERAPAATTMQSDSGIMIFALEIILILIILIAFIAYLRRRKKKRLSKK